MSRSEPTSPKRSRTDETTVVDYPTGTFKARAPAVHACRAHDKKRLCAQTKYTAPPEPTYTPTPANALTEQTPR